MAKRYVVTVTGGIEPDIFGPFKSNKKRNRAAKHAHADQDPGEDATFWLDVSKKGKVTIGAYSGLFFANECCDATSDVSFDE